MDVVVTGRVQGVFFRAAMREQADRLGVTGWVRNEPDGSVRAHLEGPRAGRGRGWSPGARWGRRAARVEDGPARSHGEVTDARDFRAG